MGSENRSGGNSDPLHLLPTVQQEQELARLEQVVVDAELARQAEVANIDSLVAAWDLAIRRALATPHEVWETFEPLELRSSGGATFRRSEDGSWYVEGQVPPRDTYEFESLVPAGTFGGLRLEVLPDASLAGDGGFGRAGNGNVVVSKLEAEIDPPGDARAIPVDLKRAEADYEQDGWAAASVLKGEQGKGWAIDGHVAEKRQPRHLAVFPDKAVAVPENSRLVIRIRQEAFDGHAIGRFRLAFSSDDPSLLGVAGVKLPDAVKAALAVDREQQTPEQKAVIVAFYRANVDGPIRQTERAHEAAKKSVEVFRDALPSAMVMKEGDPREAFLLVRGEYDKRGDRVEAALPAFLPQLPAGTKADRLSLAHWIVSRDNPLTARVWVNRIWERFFGTGLVKTSENLGSQAEYPSHPELLDWLAVEFMEAAAMPAVNGQPAQPWDMKAFIKMVLMSRRLSADRHGRAREAGPGSSQSAAGTSGPTPTAWRGRSRCAGRVGPARADARRAERSALDARRRLGRDQQIRRPPRLQGRHRHGPLPADDVHDLEADGGPTHDAPLRCAQSRDLHREAVTDEYAAAGAGAAQRDDLRRGCPRTCQANDCRGRHDAR